MQEHAEPGDDDGPPPSAAPDGDPPPERDPDVAPVDPPADPGPAPAAEPDPAPFDAPFAPYREEPRRRSALGALARLFGWAIVVVFYGSLAWAGAYRFVPPPGTFTMLERKLSGETIVHPWTPLSGISPHLVAAVIAAEDGRFCLHKGIDFAAIDEALAEKKNGGRRRGASTISQQAAKNAFLWNGGGWARKAAEAWMTLVIETLWGKRRIMEVYLNVAEWGGGRFGAEAAARGAFGKSAASLSADEAARLAAVLPSPNKWRADRPGPYVSRRAATIRQRMNVVRGEGLDACVRG